MIQVSVHPKPFIFTVKSHSTERLYLRKVSFKTPFSLAENSIRFHKIRDVLSWTTKFISPHFQKKKRRPGSDPLSDTPIMVWISNK